MVHTVHVVVHVVVVHVAVVHVVVVHVAYVVPGVFKLPWLSTNK